MAPLTFLTFKPERTTTDSVPTWDVADKLLSILRTNGYDASTEDIEKAWSSLDCPSISDYTNEQLLHLLLEGLLGATVARHLLREKLVWESSPEIRVLRTKELLVVSDIVETNRRLQEARNLSKTWELLYTKKKQLAKVPASAQKQISDLEKQLQDKLEHLTLLRNERLSLSDKNLPKIDF